MMSIDIQKFILFLIMKCYNIVRQIFRFTCASIAIILTGICFYKFTLNDDLAQIDFPIYHEKRHAIYPSLTLCFMGPNIYDEERLSTYGHGFNSTSYAAFLRGVHWVDGMMNIDFDDVTFDLEDHLEAISISSSHNQTEFKHCTENFEAILGSLMGYTCKKVDSNTKPFKITYKNDHTKCFSTDIPFDKNNKVQELRLFLKSSVFPKEHHKDFQFEDNFGIFVHYPQQFFRSPIHKMYQKLYNDSVLDLLKFKVTNLEVLRRRNKASQPCNDRWNTDDEILDKVINVVGCKPPHWNVDSNVGTCANQSHLQSYNLPFIEWIPNVPSMEFLDELAPPCQEILEINYEYIDTEWKRAEFEGLDVDTDFFEVQLLFPSSTYKEIIHVRAYDEERLVGNVGGCIGMILGLGLLQLPELLIAAHKKFVAARNQRKNESKNRENEDVKDTTSHNECSNPNNEDCNHTIHDDDTLAMTTTHDASRSECSGILINKVENGQTITRRLDVIESKLEKLITTFDRYIEKPDGQQHAGKKCSLQDEVLL